MFARTAPFGFGRTSPEVDGDKEDTDPEMIVAASYRRYGTIPMMYHSKPRVSMCVVPSLHSSSVA